ncbi:MAG: hypothetical protein OXN86_04975 [Chloroflexota bacterium]|nr:hypothetical protein [Chloroflexota bacterium]
MALSVRIFGTALIAALLVGVFAVPSTGAQSPDRGCIPETNRPVVSAVRASSGDVSAGDSPVAFQLKVRHEGVGSGPAVTVYVTINRNGATEQTTVIVPGGAGTVTTMLSVSRTSTTQTLAITVNDHPSYLACKLHAGLAFTGVQQRVPPRPPQVHPEPDPPPPPASTSTLWGPVSELSAAEQAVVAETTAGSPARPGTDPSHRNRDGSLTPEGRSAWLCWGTFGTADGC